MSEKIEQIAHEIIGYSDGAFNIAWTEEYDTLSLEEQNEVDNLVYQTIGNCGGCGWNFMYDSMEYHEDDYYCWQCFDHMQEEEEDEE